ncbi:uncharacterized protein LOC114010995 [Falco peregrinus]|uniref:uncharacterized protein LOC114010995 n=1 Tax=Falco peregrinus TaxID=8954 RepID=UPI000FFC3882|nr:uncharacterized protein LOC114010995 [Falco peregrinus]
MAGARATLLCWALLAAPGGLQLCHGMKWLEGVKGQSLCFPALRSISANIVRVTWRFGGTHIAEAKPTKSMFTFSLLPRFHGRLLIHPSNLSLEIRLLRLEDAGNYEVTVDTLSDPTKPKTFYYYLMVHDGSSETVTRTGGTGGHSRSTVAPWEATKPHGRDTVTQGTGGGQPLDKGGRSGMCPAQNGYCVVKGYLVAVIFGLLLLVVAAVHIVTRDSHQAGG